MTSAELIELLLAGLDIGSLFFALAQVVSLALVVWLCTRVLDWLLRQRITQRGHRLWWLRRRGPLIRLGLWGMGFIGVAAIVVSQATPLTLVVGLPLMLGLGLAIQDVIRNVIAGVLLAIDRDFHAGDIIRVGDVEGEVRAVRIRHVKLSTVEGHDVEIPSKVFVTEMHSNVTTSTMDAPVTIAMALPSVCDSSIARRVAFTAAAVSPYASPRRRPKVFVEPSADDPDGLSLTIRAFVLDPSLEDGYRSDVIELIHRELRTPT